jgi:superfamily II DNA or RNA helicase
LAACISPDELTRRFHLPFEILTNDKLARDEEVQQKLAAPDNRYDLVVCDEAHKLSATFFGGEVKYTKRYRLGQLVSSLMRHFLLMTATPHNGKEEDFQLGYEGRAGVEVECINSGFARV